MLLGKVVKSNSHCDYVVDVADEFASPTPPNPDEFGFGSFVKLEGTNGRHWAVGVVYNSQLVNPMFLNNGPRLSSEPDPMFTPDLISETRTLLGVVLIGWMVNQSAEVGRGASPQSGRRLDQSALSQQGGVHDRPRRVESSPYGIHAIPRVVVPVNTPAHTMSEAEVHRFHLNEADQPQFSYYSHLLHCGGSFSGLLIQQVLQELTDSGLFAGAGQRALQMLYRESAWKNTMMAMR
ncbi:MAG: hypothetical protein KME20_04275 [Kaiparowitsia implicata GSE-PSE-MK54-09C]|jgi:hypothetical protein|nr:hypothetical protein [Kaiparowitsia implicata GSE-PSE-MK54-09C]